MATPSTSAAPSTALDSGAVGEQRMALRSEQKQLLDSANDIINGPGNYGARLAALQELCKLIPDASKVYTETMRGKSSIESLLRYLLLHVVWPIRYDYVYLLSDFYFLFLA